MKDCLRRTLEFVRGLWKGPVPRRRDLVGTQRNPYEFRRSLRDRIRRKLRGAEHEANRRLADTGTTRSS